MAKKRINTYKFTPGIPQSGNLYPNAWAQINANKEWLKDESNAFLDFKITQDTAANLYPNATLRYLNNREYVKAEVAAWVAVQVAGNIAPFAGYTATATQIKNDLEEVLQSAYLDMRYGGNENIRTQSQTYYIDGVLQLASAGERELAYWIKAKQIIDLYIFTGLAYGTINGESLSQNSSGSNAEAAGKTGFAANMAVIDTVVDDGILNYQHYQVLCMRLPILLMTVLYVKETWVITLMVY